MGEGQKNIIGTIRCPSPVMMGYYCKGESELEERDINNIKKIWVSTCKICGYVKVHDTKPLHMEKIYKYPSQVTHEIA